MIAVPPTASEWRSDRSYLYRERVLRPGQTALFRWAASNTVADWTADPAEPVPPRASVHLEVFDSAVHGVIDMVKLEVRARPLQAVSRRSGHWTLTDAATDVDVIVFPTQRRYLTEEPLPD